MTYDMAKTELEGFPIQYGEDVVRHLNEVNNSRMFNNLDLDKIGKQVSSDFEHNIYGKTRDGYEWFATLNYKIEDSKIAILIPWSQDWDHPESQMDRSINVYSDKSVPEEKVKNLLEKLAYQMALKKPREIQDFSLKAMLLAS
jgi:hypothetical protein